MKKPSLDSASIKNFFLYHSEKLILGLSIVLLGLFFWFGYSTPTFESSTPSKLVSQAKTAHSYMISDEAWNKISNLREGDDKVMNRIASVANVQPDLFNIGPTSYPVKRDELRRDAILERPSDLVAKSILASILVEPRRQATDPLAIYPPVQPDLGDEEGKSSGGLGLGLGAGLSMGPGSGEEPKRKSRKKKSDDDVDVGTFYSVACHCETPGIRNRFSTSDVMSFNLNAVAVTGIVEHEKMHESFSKMYASSFGYHPDRDTPRYDFVQVERRAIDDAGNPGGWDDISNFLSKQSELLPSGLDVVPEVVSAEEWDHILTMPILPFAGIDYKDFANHPKTSKREFVVAEVVEEKKANAGNTFTGGDDDDEDKKKRGNRRSGRRKNALGSSGGLGMGGMGMGGMGMSGSGGDDDLGSMGGSMGMGGMGMGGMGMGGLGGSGKAGRVASDYTAYQEIDIRKPPAKAHKVVRFFDIYELEAGKTYQYRVRVWYRDPNNEDPELAGEVSQSGDGAMGGMGASMGMSGMGRGRSGDDDEDDEKAREAAKFARKQTIASNMIDPGARERLSRAREVEGADGELEYYVSERFTNENGEEEWAEIKVPKEHEYLRFARPSAWSDNIEVKVDVSPSFVYAGEPVELRRVDVGRGSIVDGEPSMTVATGKYVQEGSLEGVKVPYKKVIKAGDLLDFNQATHVRHPVTWQIHRVTDVEVQTGAVVLDVSDGEELDTKKSSPIPYFYPGEALVMDSLGNIKLSNDLEDRGNYLAAVLGDDDKASFGGRRRKKKETPSFGAGTGFGLSGGGDESDQ